MSLAFQERFRDRIAVVGRQGELEVTESRPVNKEMSKRGMQSLPLSPALTFARPIKLHQSPTPSSVDPYPRSHAPTEPPYLPASSLKSTETHSTLHFKTPPGGTLSESLPLTSREISDNPTRLNPPPRSETPQKPTNHRRAIQRPALLTSSNPQLPVKSLQTGPRSQPSFSPYTLQDYRLIRPAKYMVLGGLGPHMVGSQEWLKKRDLDNRRKTYGQQVIAANSHRLSLNSSGRHSEAQSTPFSSSSRQRAMDFSRGIHPPSPKFPRVSVFLERRY